MKGKGKLVAFFMLVLLSVMTFSSCGLDSINNIDSAPQKEYYDSKTLNEYSEKYKEETREYVSQNLPDAEITFINYQKYYFKQDMLAGRALSDVVVGRYSLNGKEYSFTYVCGDKIFYDTRFIDELTKIYGDQFASELGLTDYEIVDFDPNVQAKVMSYYVPIKVYTDMDSDGSAVIDMKEFDSTALVWGQVPDELEENDLQDYLDITEIMDFKSLLKVSKESIDVESLKFENLADYEQDLEIEIYNLDETEELVIKSDSKKQKMSIDLTRYDSKKQVEKRAKWEFDKETKELKKCED